MHINTGTEKETQDDCKSYVAHQWVYIDRFTWLYVTDIYRIVFDRTVFKPLCVDYILVKQQWKFIMVGIHTPPKKVLGHSLLGGLNGDHQI